jgi:hypothetical protein
MGQTGRQFHTGLGGRDALFYLTDSDRVQEDFGKLRLFSPLKIWLAVRPRIEASSSSTK